MEYLSAEAILLIHEYQLERYGGTPGLRSIELLESAAYRPQTSFSGQEKYQSVFEKAASLTVALITNHPFTDGNKRTSMVAGILFLEINGISLSINQDELVRQALQAASNEMDVDELAAWLEKNSH